MGQYFSQNDFKKIDINTVSQWFLKLSLPTGGDGKVCKKVEDKNVFQIPKLFLSFSIKSFPSLSKGGLINWPKGANNIIIK